MVLKPNTLSKMNRIELHLNTTCNQSCVFCATSRDDPFSLDTESAKRLISKSIDDGADMIVFGGGEPTLRNDLSTLANYIKSINKKVEVLILTNAIRLSNKKYLDSLRSVDDFSVSLHGVTPSVNDALTRTPGSFDKTLKGAINLQESGHRFNFYYVITRSNYTQLCDFVEMVHKDFSKCNSITFAYPFYSGNVKKYPFIQPVFSEFIPVLKCAKHLCRTHNLHFNLASCGLMPLCVLGKSKDIILRNNILFNEKTIKIRGFNGDEKYTPTNETFQKENFVRARCCKKCCYFSACPGVWKSYADLYGTKELHSIEK